jgi:hypothetical protein
MSDSSAPPTPAELYVGYLPVPARIKSFLRFAVPALIAVLWVAGILWTGSQSSPGKAVWDLSKPVRITGTIIARPYPMLLSRSHDSGTQLYLLVESGKHGASRAAPFDGQLITATGYLLSRDQLRMIELDPDLAALAPASPSEPIMQPPAPQPPSRVTLRGEIVDSKCFLGAMKPGTGKTHKDCAALCVRGGIPPLFIVRSADSSTAYLLRDPSGGPIDPSISPFIADPIELSGELSTLAGVPILTVRPSDIRRLSP